MLVPEGGYPAVIVKYAQLFEQAYQDAIECLPSVADLGRQNVIDLAEDRAYRAIETAIEAKNAR
jgi:hypothetical protein